MTIYPQEFWLKVYRAWLESGLTKKAFYEKHMADQLPPGSPVPVLATFFRRLKALTAVPATVKETSIAANHTQPASLPRTGTSTVQLRTVAPNIQIAEISEIMSPGVIPAKTPKGSRAVSLCLRGGTTLAFESHDPELFALRVMALSQRGIV